MWTDGVGAGWTAGLKRRGWRKSVLERCCGELGIECGAFSRSPFKIYRSRRVSGFCVQELS